MEAAILTIGDEILIGQIVDTNSAWLGNKLNEVGVRISKILSVGDNRKDIEQSVEMLMEKYRLVLVTGGLGPTNDDITKNVLCDYFNCKLVQSDEVLANINELLGKRGVPLNQNNLNQALVPDKAVVLNNRRGTAPAMLFEKNGSFLISMPGVPFEMKWITENYVLPFIKDKFDTNQIFHKTIVTSGLPESVLAEKIADWENSLPEYVKLAYLPSPGFIRLRLSIYNYLPEYQTLIDELVAQLKLLIPKNVIGEEDKKPEVLLGDLLKIYGKTMCTAESCTGGTIASMITSVPGSSAYFWGSIVSYDNSVKMNLLGVSKFDLEKYGAVSQQVVEQMAKGAITILKTDYAVSVSGVAGPDGGTPEKPVGTVWIAVASPNSVVSKKFQFFNDRDINIKRAANSALAMLIDFVREDVE
ncbi:MAG: CinA family nicotinamide mononucleotide deamidase-related protein [Bacteroidales bacterium]|nr:CinA family nicotinamide mononucleotide deamidase-related protein [Bacteroidales bacterium]